MYDKKVFVKHEQAPTAPKLEGGMVFFVDVKYILYENPYFGQFDNFRWVVLIEMVKGHICGPIHFI